MTALLILVLLSPAVSARTVGMRPLGPALAVSLAAPAPSRSEPAAATLSLPPALSPSPALAAAVSAPAPVPLALAPAKAAPSTPDEKPAAPGTPRAVAALAASEAGFKRLVSDLMGTDAGKASAAATALRALKDEHLDPGTDGKKTRILGLKPMQIPAGMIEVQQKAKDLRDLKKKDADAWLKERAVPFIEDYKGRMRPVDHHHEARAAWEAGLDEIYARPYLDEEMQGRLKALPRVEFYAVARAMGLFFDRDQFGAGPHDPNHLPEDVRGMADDPYRSLAWQVRKRGGFDKTAVPFAEFKWAQHFRERLTTYPTRADFEAAVVEALQIAHDPAARDLPGWRPR